MTQIFRMRVGRKVTKSPVYILTRCVPQCTTVCNAGSEKHSQIIARLPLQASANDHVQYAVWQNPNLFSNNIRKVDPDREWPPWPFSRALADARQGLQINLCTHRQVSRLHVIEQLLLFSQKCITQILIAVEQLD